MSEVKEQVIDKVAELTSRMGERGVERMLDIGEGMAIMKEIVAAAREQPQAQAQSA